MRWYLYGLTDCAPELPGAGVGGQPVFAAVHHGVWLLASSWTDRPPPGLDPAGVFAHEGVVEVAMEAGSVLPFRFGLVAEEEECRAFVDRHLAGIRLRLDAVAGHVEVSLKLLERGIAEPLPCAPAEIVGTSGTAYLRRKQTEFQQQEAREARSAALVEAIEPHVAPWVRQRHHRLAPDSRVLAVMTHLIPRTALANWVQSVNDLQSRFPDVSFLASGPWPPYHFAEVTCHDGDAVGPLVDRTG